MTINLNAVSVQSGISVTPVAPLIEGAAAAALDGAKTLNSAASTYFDFGSNLTGRYGMRVNLPSPRSFAGYDFATFAAGVTQYSAGTPLDTVANGGMRIFFIDAAGNHAGFNVYGSLPLYDAGTAAVDGFLAGYSTTNFVFSIALARTPDVASGVLDWSNITAIEATIKTLSPARRDFHLSRLVRRSAPFFTGTETLASLDAAVRSAAGSATGDPLLLKSAPPYLRGAAQTNFNVRLGLTVGNGVAATTFVESSFAIGFENPYEFSPAFASIGPWVQLDDARTRAFKILQGASDVLSLTDGSLSSAGWWQWELSGSGVATCTRVQFWRFNGFRAAHGSYIDCAWNKADAPVEVTAATVITGGLIRDAVASGLKILGAAGSYAALGITLNNPTATYDIELGSGGAGTYDLGGIKVPAGYTLKLRNNSASNAITVAIPAGMAYSTSTAGGTITISTPTVYVDIAAPALIAGSRAQLYNITDGVEMYNDVLAGAGLTLNLAYTANKTVRLRADHDTKLPLETLGLLTPSGLTFLDVQVEDDVYLDNGVDGSTVTEFAPDGPSIEVDINDPDGITNVQRLYAWLQWYMTTEEGVRSTFFGAVTAIDNANYQIDQAKADIKLDNIAAAPVRVIGGNLTRRDGSTVIAVLSNSIQMDPGKAYLVESGVSGLTPDESSKLDAVGSLALETTAQAGKYAAELAASHAAAVLALPAPPSAIVIRDAVWADATVATLAIETTAQAAKTAAEALPTAAAVTAAVWADPAVAALALETTAQATAAAIAALPAPPSVAGLALESTAQAALAQATASAADAAAILSLPAPPTAAEVWADPAAAGVAQETTAQTAASNAALAAALSA